MKTKQEGNKAPHRKGLGADVGDSTGPPQAPTAGLTEVRPSILVRSRRSSFIPAASKAAACALLLLALEARSQLAPDGAPLQYSATLFAQGNPRALALDLRLQYRHELGAAGSGSGIGGFADVAVGPAGLRPGVRIEIQPLANLSFGADYSASYYFGTVGLAQSYPSPKADYGSGAFTGPVSGPGGSYALWVQQLSMHATLQAILGPFAVRSTTRAARFFADLHPNDRVFYDPLFDVTVYKNGWVGQNDTDLVYPWTSNLIVGLRHTLTLGPSIPHRGDGERRAPVVRVWAGLLRRCTALPLKRFLDALDIRNSIL